MGRKLAVFPRTVPIALSAQAFAQVGQAMCDVAQAAGLIADFALDDERSRCSRSS